MWNKKSIIFKTSGSFSWAKTHAQVPTALLKEDCIRIYYAARDAEGRSLTSFVDVARDNPSKVLYIHDRPILDLGAPGTHDDDGVMTGGVLWFGDEVLMYYTGWCREVTVPYKVSVGLARSNDGGTTFERVFDGPVVDRTANEPYMTMSPYVLKEDSLWKMWYGSGIGWVSINGKMEPRYCIKYAESLDGFHWHQPNVTCIEPLDELEANTRPSVARTESGYEMWFSYRSSVDFRAGTGGYRIGYATSPDGKKWERQQDPAELIPGCEDWSKHMVAYPNVLNVDGKRLMFFNGDGFGQTGFGYAVWEPQPCAVR